MDPALRGADQAGRGRELELHRRSKKLASNASSLDHHRWVAVSIRLGRAELDEIAECSLAHVSEEEREGARATGRPRGRHSLISRFLVRHLLSLAFDRPARSIPIVRTPNGKPYVSDAGCHFNVSHSSNTFLIGLSTNPIGVDVEAVPFWHEGLERWMGGSRMSSSSMSPSPSKKQALTENWVIAEACIKAAGLRLTDTRHFHERDVDAGRWGSFRWELLPIAPATAAVASRANDDRPGSLCFGSLEISRDQLILNIDEVRPIY